MNENSAVPPLKKLLFNALRIYFIIVAIGAILIYELASKEMRTIFFTVFGFVSFALFFLLVGILYAARKAAQNSSTGMITPKRPFLLDSPSKAKWVFIMGFILVVISLFFLQDDSFSPPFIGILLAGIISAIRGWKSLENIKLKERESQVSLQKDGYRSVITNPDSNKKDL